MDVFALDFDGVLCDSSAETGVTAWRAGSRLWPEWGGSEPPPACLARFLKLRPLLETGYQAILLMRLIWEGIADACIERQFGELCSRAITQASMSPTDLVRLFGQTRDHWLEHDLAGWLGRHAFYPGVLEACAAKTAAAELFILTTKERRFAQTLLGSRGLYLPEQRIYGLEAGQPKEEILQALSCEPTLRGCRFHFVEDRVATLLRVARVATLQHVRLYLASWGYATAADVRQAEECPRITVWRVQDFLRL